ncbi:MAG TPA: DUF4175 family protein [Cyclobacteriaceae bacterium]|nr:DUF4175 family protein [Cyclobacteriaceae bacterium]
MSHLASISHIRSKYLRIRWSEVVFFGLSAATIAGAIALISGLPTIVIIGVAFASGMVVAFWRYKTINLSEVDNLRISLYLNRFYPELKESSDLLLKTDDALSTLERIQLNRIDNKIGRLIPQIKLPHSLPQSLLALVAGVILFAGAIILVPFIHSTDSQTIDQSTTSEGPSTPPDPSIKSLSVNITPPAYTRLPKTTSDNLTFAAAEGSEVKWTISFHQPVSNARIVMTSGDSIVQSASVQQVEFKYTLTTSVLYRIRWMANGESHSSDYHRIDVKPDQAPQVSIKELPQFTRLKWGEKNSIEVTSGVADDYGLTAAHVIATVSKGSGESVKFREEKISFSSPAKVSGTGVTGKLTLDFKKLGMDPGDEVYFYVEAFDNKQPSSQRNRTDTYFVALQDTATQEMAMEDGLGVDIMPDYFRSQRQLIIDTEKLLAEQKKITKQQFNSTSNELGYDQKVLRLRYGQFLGEEFETSIGENAAHDDVEEGEKKDEDILKKYGHQHDNENEHNQVADKKGKEPEGGHDHGDEKSDKDDPLAPYRHNHDSEEEATFFTQSIKAKLRAALTLMWDSELQLRLYHPKESLPYQYQILKLLKEISQDSRIYVHRMGFDPPPLKEEKRLTGLLDEINPARIEYKGTNGLKYPAIRAALTDIATALANDSVGMTDQQRTNLHAAGDELAGLALKSPGSYLGQLSDLKLIAENKAPANEVRAMLEEIQKALWAVVPNEAPSPTQRGSGAHPLDVKFLEEIKAKAND